MSRKSVITEKLFTTFIARIQNSAVLIFVTYLLN